LKETVAREFPEVIGHKRLRTSSRAYVSEIAKKSIAKLLQDIPEFLES
jgi:hypothetical protein